MIMEKIKFGLVGCGMICPKHFKAIEELPEAELIAVCDIDKEKAEKFSKEQNCKSYTNYEDMIDDPEIDIISICTPNGLHADMAVAALNSKKHVLCEKPMALNITDTKRIIKAEQESGKKFILVKQNRFNPPVAALKDAVYNNKLGNIVMIGSNVYWNRNDQYYENSKWRGTKKLDGGTLFTQASHFLDLMLWIGGPVKSVQSYMNNFNHPKIEIEDTGVVLIKFKNGTLGKIIFTTCVYNHNLEGSIFVLGSKGTIKVGGKYLNELEHWDVENTKLPILESSSPPNEYGTYQGTMSNHDKVYKNVLNVLLKEEKIKTNSIQGHESVEVMQAAYLSAETGKEVFLPLKEENEITAIIPAAGKGTRMYPITNSLHKSLIHVNGKTLLQRSISILKKAGINRFIVVTGHKEDQVKNYIKNNLSEENIQTVTQEEMLGIPHVLKTASHLIDSDFMLFCPDNIYEDPKDIITSKKLFEKHKPIVLQTATVKPNSEKNRGNYFTNDLENLEENLFLTKKQEQKKEGVPLFATGITFFSKEILNHLPTFESSTEEHSFPTFLSKLPKTYMIYLLRGLRHDITAPEDIEKYTRHLSIPKTQEQGISIILLNKNKEILMQQRDNIPTIRYPGYWGLFGGSIEDNETPEEAIIREVKEEINFDLKNFGLFRVFTQNEKKEYAFIGEIDKEIEELNLTEGQNMKFFKPGRILSLEVRSDDLATIKKYMGL